MYGKYIAQIVERRIPDIGYKAWSSLRSKGKRAAVRRVARTTAELGWLERLGKRILKKGAKQGAKALAEKWALVPFFAYDWYDGGFVHACNEAVWPLSELWNDEEDYGPPPGYEVYGSGGYLIDVEAFVRHWESQIP